MRRAWLDFAPRLADEVEQKRFLAGARILALASELSEDSERTAVVEEQRRKLSRLSLKGNGGAIAATLILCDLVSHNWKCRFRKQTVQIQSKLPSTDSVEDREQVRTRLHIERDRQLRSDSVQSFIEGMERRRLFRGRWVSIFSLMRDGKELSASLALNSGDAIRPYMQTIRDNGICDLTGLALRDIWRYFRHTWSNPYRSVPGRSLLLLVRDSAAEFHPVIGIAALASSAVQISPRDKWIGWSTDQYVEHLREHASERHINWLFGLVEDGLSGIYQDDLLDSATSPLTRQLLAHPSDEIIEWLQNYAAEQRKEHQRLAEARDHKKSKAHVDDDTTWRMQAENPLFRSKRAETIAVLLKARQVLQEKGKPTPSSLKQTLQEAGSRQIIQSLVRRAKSDRVGISMADISVCGAVAPYSSLLGGKLVSMLVASPEVVNFYHDRYAKTPSIIASSMAGRPVVRAPHLVLLGTTSLYGTEPTQYTRVAIPCDKIGGRRGESIRFKLLGRTEGYGTFQFSPETVEAISNFLSQSAGGQRVHSIFGEGVNPRLRKIREGFDRLNLPSDILLTHGNQRLIYAVTLAQNFRNYLVGLDNNPDYLFSLKDACASTKAIADWWAERWLVPRLRRTGILAEVESHRLTHPVNHGARVPLTSDQDRQFALFSDITGESG
jgi:hypothetical protein